MTTVGAVLHQLRTIFLFGPRPQLRIDRTGVVPRPANLAARPGEAIPAALRGPGKEGVQARLQLETDPRDPLGILLQEPGGRGGGVSLRRPLSSPPSHPLEPTEITDRTHGYSYREAISLRII